MFLLLITLPCLFYIHSAPGVVHSGPFSISFIIIGHLKQRNPSNCASISPTFSIVCNKMDCADMRQCCTEKSQQLVSPWARIGHRAPPPHYSPRVLPFCSDRGLLNIGVSSCTPLPTTLQEWYHFFQRTPEHRSVIVHPSPHYSPRVLPFCSDRGLLNIGVIVHPSPPFHYSPRVLPFCSGNSWTSECHRAPPPHYSPRVLLFCSDRGLLNIGVIVHPPFHYSPRVLPFCSGNSWTSECHRAPPSPLLSKSATILFRELLNIGVSSCTPSPLLSKSATILLWQGTPEHRCHRAPPSPLLSKSATILLWQGTPEHRSVIVHPPPDNSPRVLPFCSGNSWTSECHRAPPSPLLSKIATILFRGLLGMILTMLQKKNWDKLYYGFQQFFKLNAMKIEFGQYIQF